MVRVQHSNGSRVWVLLRSEFSRSTSNFFFVFVLATPLALTLLVTLVFGDLFDQTPRLGVYAEDDTQMVRMLTESPAIRTTVYDSEAALRASVAQGVTEVGVIYRKGFDEAVRSGASMNMTWLMWGEESQRSAIIAGTEIYKAEWELTGTTPLVSLNVTQLGDPQVSSMAARLLPLFVLMTIVIGGVLLPATSLVSEKQQRTLNALTITPTTLTEVYLAKALLGIGVSIVMGLVVLALNRAFGSQPLLLVSTLALGAIAASIFGVLLGSLIGDQSVLLATLKTAGLILFAPAVVQLVPSLPAWLAYVFPTYYVMDPVLQVGMKGAGLDHIIGELGIELAIIATMLFALRAIIVRQQSGQALFAQPFACARRYLAFM